MKKTLKNLIYVYKNYGRDYKKHLIYETIGSILAVAVGIALPILTAKQVVYLTDNVWNQLIIMSLVILGVNIIAALKTVLIRKNTQAFTVGSSTKMQKELSKEVLRISQKEMDRASTGSFVNRLTNDTGELVNIFTVGYGRLVGIVSTVGTFIAVLVINRYVFLFYLVVAICLTSLNVIKSRKYNQKDREKRDTLDTVSSLSSELVRGVRDIKMLNAKESFNKSLARRLNLTKEKYLEMRNVEIFYNNIIEILTAVFEFLLIMIFIYLIKVGDLSIAMAIALYSYRYRIMFNFMENISSLIDEANNFNLSFERVFTVIGNETYEKEKFGNVKIKRLKGNFEFKNVRFSYDKDMPVLKDVSFKVDANQTVGFVGKSGSGKTTIFNLMCKFYDIDSGSILIDGKNIKDLDEESIRGNITIISQNPYIFNMSFIDNMKLVKSNVTLKEIKEACKVACLDEYIESLPEGYNTTVGEGGVNLSGGQRQRLAIARALIQKTGIILFDEATSALDNETQIKIQKAIDNLKGDYTVMIIAHRLSTIINCDIIYVLDNGSIVDSGTHKQLLKKNKMYKRLCETELVEK
jgi:ABC-type multidrug transport system fused ATPase/permease subunit